MNGVPLPLNAGVSILGRSGVFSIDQAQEIHARKLMGFD